MNAVQFADLAAAQAGLSSWVPLADGGHLARFGALKFRELCHVTSVLHFLIIVLLILLSSCGADMVGFTGLGDSAQPAVPPDCKGPADRASTPIAHPRAIRRRPAAASTSATTDRE